MNKGSPLKISHHGRSTPPRLLAVVLRSSGASLPPEEFFTFCVSPANADDPAVSSALLNFVSSYNRRGSIAATTLQHTTLRSAVTEVRWCNTILVANLANLTTNTHYQVVVVDDSSMMRDKTQ